VKSQTYIAPTRSGNPQRAVVITGHSTQAKADILLDPEEEVQATLVRHIPPIALGQVEILDIIREPRVMSKVIVRSMKSDCNPVMECLGRDAQYLRAVTEELQESVWFIPWNEEPEQFLLDCLGVIRNNLYSIKIDREQQVAEIILTSKDAAAKAVGTNGSNIRLAQKITGLTIEIFQLSQNGEKTKSKQTASPEEEISPILSKYIPEIASGAIKVVDIAREVSVLSKVVVQNVSSSGNPLKKCIGVDQNILRPIIDELGEAIWFVNWDEDPNKFLVNCLGIRWNELVSVTIDRAMLTALVVVKDGTTVARAVGEDGVNVKLARQLTHLRKIRILEEKNNATSL
jgi:transcription antitermination factor NusA-like protein